MRTFRPTRDADGTLRLGVPLRGSELLCEPMYNKGTAFTHDERVALGLEGLLPAVVSDLDTQVRKIDAHIQRKQDPLQQYIGLAALQDLNEHAFYRLLLDHIETYLPIVYTPTVGLACQQYSHIFRRSRGIWITPDHAGRMCDVLRCAPGAKGGDVRLIVVTDGERILGLGDQGAGGMGIPIGKLALYTVAAGIHASQTLPVCLDFGTDNERRLSDDMYIGWRHPRVRGDQYDVLVEEFVSAVKTVFPHALLQWEDFKKANAMRLLDRYRERLLSFNDDIQGTAAIAVAGVLSGVKATGRRLADHRVVILGAGAAGAGIERLIRRALVSGGLEERDARMRIAVLDSRGLLTTEREYRPDDAYKMEHAWEPDMVRAVGLGSGGADFESVVRAFRPTVLIGTSGQAGMFTEDIVRQMAAEVDHPIVFPLSNPTSKSEATPADIYSWTDGRAFVATGSPFDPVDVDERTLHPAQGNNVYVFPAVGLGALAVEAREVTNGMFLAAAEALAEEVEPSDRERGALYPPLTKLRELTPRLALAVGVEGCRAGVAPARSPDEIGAAIEEMMWYPEYPLMEPA